MLPVYKQEKLPGKGHLLFVTLCLIEWRIFFACVCFVFVFMSFKFIAGTQYYKQGFFIWQVIVRQSAKAMSHVEGLLKFKCDRKELCRGIWSKSKNL